MTVLEQRDGGVDGSNWDALSDLAPQLANVLVSVASDIALVIDEQGVIQQIALGGSEPFKTMADEWVGRRLTDVVTVETRRKVEQLLADVAATGQSRSRQVNHPSPLGLDVPIAYSAVRLGKGGPMLAVGRDMSVVSAMQQRLIHAQQEMERDYWQRRQSETRYQLLFQIATDAVLVVDANSFNVIDANLAAARLFGMPLDQLIGKRATAPLHDSARDDVMELFATARSSGRAVETQSLLPDRVSLVRVLVTPLRSEASTALLMRVHRVDPDWQVPQAGARLLSLMALSPDAIVVTDGEGRIQMANPAFMNLAQIDVDDGLQDRMQGRMLGEWLGSNASDIAALLSLLRRESTTRNLFTIVRGAEGRLLSVDVSAARMNDDDQESFGFILRASHGGASVRVNSIESSDPSIH